MEIAPTSSATVLSPGWLEQALAPPLGAVKVTAVRVVQTIKVSATKIRFAVDLQGRPEALELCIKGYFDGPMTSVQQDISRCEARFYAQLADDAGLIVPRSYYAAADDAAGHGVVLMEDITAQGGRFLTVLEPYSIEQASRSLDQLARLHALRWDKRGDRALDWVGPAIEWMLDRPMISADELTALMNGERGDPLPPALRSGERLIATLRSMMERLAHQPSCLVHGDAHAGNAFEFRREQGFVDWQLLQWGSWSLDVAYHLGVVLSVENRRSYEQQLLSHYLGRLAEFGAPAPGFAEAWEEYRAQLAYGFYLWAITRKVRPDITLEMVRRLGLAVADHGSLERLGV
jgi:hypothetical protein